MGKNQGDGRHGVLPHGQAVDPNAGRIDARTGGSSNQDCCHKLNRPDGPRGPRHKLVTATVFLRRCYREAPHGQRAPTSNHRMTRLIYPVADQLIRAFRQAASVWFVKLPGLSSRRIRRQALHARRIHCPNCLRRADLTECRLPVANCTLAASNRTLGEPDGRNR